MNMNMAVLLWVFAGLQVLGAFATVSIIGKPRKPISNGAAGISVLSAFIAVAAVLWATR